LRLNKAINRVVINKIRLKRQKRNTKPLNKATVRYITNAQKLAAGAAAQDPSKQHPLTQAADRSIQGSTGEAQRWNKHVIEVTTALALLSITVLGSHHSFGLHE
jgi:hypothetical protein